MFLEVHAGSKSLPVIKKQIDIVLCVCRENLSKDLYLISQMDSDHFVPIWTIACLDDIKALTTDMDLILDVLRGIDAAALPVFVRNAPRHL